MKSKQPLSIKQFFQRNNMTQARILYLFAAFMVSIAVLVVLWFGYQAIRTKSVSVNIVLPTDEISSDSGDTCELRRRFDGICVENEHVQRADVITVMIENNIDAQPLAGVAAASIVYEVPVEGGIPRFLAVYHKDTVVEKVGPVRSARPYFLDWVAEYGTPMYMHVGGSPEALDRIVARSMFDMNEFYRGWYYWRSTDRLAPHNTYTSSELWNAAHERYAATSTFAEVEDWTFDVRDTCVSDCTKSLTIAYGGAYTLTWEFNSSTRRYDRSQFHRRHRDDDGTPYVADTILVQQVDATVLDAVGRLSIDTIGEGKGYVLRDGYVFSAVWKKESLATRTRWYDDSGTELVLKPGKIWVEVVTNNTDVEWK